MPQTYPYVEGNFASDDIWKVCNAVQQLAAGGGGGGATAANQTLQLAQQTSGGLTTAEYLASLQDQIGTSVDGSTNEQLEAIHDDINAHFQTLTFNQTVTLETLLNKLAQFLNVGDNIDGTSEYILAGAEKRSDGKISSIYVNDDKELLTVNSGIISGGSINSLTGTNSSIANTTADMVTAINALTDPYIIQAQVVPKLVAGSVASYEYYVLYQ